MVVMSPLKSQVLVSAPFIEADITYNETTQFPYTFNVTAVRVVVDWSNARCNGLKLEGIG